MFLKNLKKIKKKTIEDGGEMKNAVLKTSNNKPNVQ